MIRLRCAPAGDASWFARSWPLLELACHDATAAEVYAAYKAGTAQLWVATDGRHLRAACVTQTAGDGLHMWLCGGGGCDWRELGDGIADAARGRFRRLTIAGRPGWGRVLGFTRAADGLMERRL